MAEKKNANAKNTAKNDKKGYEKALAEERFVSTGKGVTFKYPNGKVVKH